MKWLQTCDESGRPHVLRLDEYEAGLHVRSSNRYASCVCNPRIVDGVIVHRQMTRGNLYAPWQKGGN